MGFRYRKSINLGGGFRINMSKSGIGYSWGTKGYRVTKTAKGKTRTTYSIPGTGLSYVSESGQNKSQSTRSRTQQSQSRQTNRPSVNQVTQENNLQRNIETDEIANFQAAEFENITSTIAKTIRMNKWGTGLLWCVLLAFSNPVLVLLPILGIILKVISHKSGVVTLEYDFDAEKDEEYKRRTGAWIILAEGDKEWQVLTEVHNSNTKVHAGANRSLNRVPCEIKKVTPFYLRTNVDIIQIKLKKETFLILPDKVLIIRGSKVGAENYSDVQILASSTYFVESDRVPKDAQVVRHTWQYVNKNGTPDKRYKNNRQLPVCHYGVVTIKSDSGIEVEIQVSNIQKCKDFAMLIQ